MRDIGIGDWWSASAPVHSRTSLETPTPRRGYRGGYRVLGNTTESALCVWGRPSPRRLRVADSALLPDLPAKRDTDQEDSGTDQQERPGDRMTCAKMTNTLLGGVAFEALEEARRASDSWPPMNSAHEGYAVILEELDELWEHVKTNQKRRDLAAMHKEAIQVAAMAIRFAVEVCDEDRGRK